jgi:hypothetical protein
MKPTLPNNLDKLTTKEKRIIRINQGPRFQTKGGTILAMIFLLFFIMSIASLVHGEFLASLVSLILSIITIYPVLDIHGIEVDTGIRKIRDYKLFLWFRIGKWSQISEFKTIYLTQKKVIVGTSKYSEHAADTYHYYHIKLVDEIHKKEIFLAEYKNYYKAQKISVNIANATGLEFKDFLKGSRVK